jgi:hypothetical protein
MPEKKPKRPDAGSRRAGEPYPVRLPGFLLDREVGLGDLLKRATSGLGIRPCGGCNQRAEVLNRRVVLYGRGSSRGRHVT